MPIKTFRGLMKTATQDRIHLHTNDGSIGYRIVKFELMASAPGAADYEAIVKVYTDKQEFPFPTPGGVSDASIIDFSDNTLLAAGTYQGNAAAFNYPTTQFVTFDNKIFNQDIFVTFVDLQGNNMNYYIELEQVKLDLNENTVATLTDIRNS